MFKNINILKLFFEEPTREFNVREVARLIKISPATASKELKNFVKEELLKERKEKIFNFYKANLESDAYTDLKTYYNVRKIKESGLLAAINKDYLKPTVVLFGSAASGLDTETSDIDLLIISDFLTIEFKELKRFEAKLKKKIQILNFRDIKEIKNEHLVNNVLNGITIQGKVKWI